MRRISAVLVALVALVGSVGVLSVAPALAATQVRSYAGPTSDGGSVRIEVVVANGMPYLTLLLFEGTYRCEDGTEVEIDDLDGVGWWRRGPALDDGRVEVSENWGAVAFDFSGRLGTRGGSGTLTVLLPELSADERSAQVCTLGEVTWTVERTSEEDSSAQPRITAGGASGGSVAVGFGAYVGGTSVRVAETDGRPLRHYDGRTSQERWMRAHTTRVEGGIAVPQLDVDYLLACDDGSQVDGGIRPTTLLETTPVMPVGRLDVDLIPHVGLLGAIALHVHGELDAHAGSGTFSMVTASLTDDRHALLCRSGDQTWRLWRTDAGF